ncbi:alpha/beta hydrolase [Ensifer adhaerens]|uniref:alpha/beta fold hydrolase n=1 Tax=Ensifer adhaerens TaxID=106592 RepID=UPI001CBBA8E8|nr:alpha/beta fold hydrolase [Ensifer adhaerens]MBZ7921906.1 alpha/beta hydrolase [Ensifer adhaerens]UAX94301.1 alpha/beta hydrolase [Ensifer adhaerens]UAY01936.1 alpha/beta hydrolase [Ensifer adhaerens]UAY09319.1 alpha/beta hydrolase [Ensifer adhaerens]
MASFAIKVIRHALKGVAAFSPEAAGNLAFKLFSVTPGRKPRNAKEKAALAAAEPVIARAKPVTLSYAGGWVLARQFAAPHGAANAKRILLVHGWGSRSDYLAAMIDGLVKGGAEVVTLDWPGHGGSPGRTLTMPAAVRAIDAAWRHFGNFDVCAGHSFGGASLACAAGGIVCDVRSHVARKLVLIGAPSEMTWLFKGFGKILRLAPKTQAAFEGVVERLSGRRIEEFDAARIIGVLAVPTLIIHAEDDKEVAADHARRYAAAGPNVEMHWANGFGHRRIVSAAPVIARINAFIHAEDQKAAA